MSNWEDQLYTHGFLLTDDKEILSKNIGIKWESWTVNKLGKYEMYSHPNQKVNWLKKNNTFIVLVGHAYNPFSNEYSETDILKKLSDSYGTDSYCDYFDELTGLFFYAVIENDIITANTDCAGLLGAYYAKINGNVYFSAYSQMIADLFGLDEDPYVTKIKKSKLFHLYGWFLPGDMSPYKEVRRIIPNTEIKYEDEFICHRFYPRKNYSINGSDEEYRRNLENICGILHNSMSLITKKWERPAISLTGGMDSQTTLACAKDLQKKFGYFSYVSLEREETDANAAHRICESKGLNHKIYLIETDKTKLSEFEEVNNLVRRHYSYLGYGNENDICKRICLKKYLDIDIEVKSWVSEVARASRYKMYGKKKLPKSLTPRLLTTMYKVFIFNRKDAIETDKMFQQYIDYTKLKDTLEKFNYPWSEFFVWEIVFGGWGSLALTGEHSLTNDITVPYNNRALLDMMLRTPLQYRIDDRLNKDIIEFMDKQLYDLEIHVVNGNETFAREMFEKIYFNIHSKLPW